MDFPTAAPYAVLRVHAKKAKTMAAIAAASEHHMQSEPSPNHDPGGEPPIVMHIAAGKTPYQAASHLLEGAERRNRETVLCREVVLSASASYFRPGREDQAGEFDFDAMQAWAKIAVQWARRQWPDQLASATLHLGESVPHLHLLVVPRTKTAGGGWKLNSKALFDRERLRELQTSFADAVAPLGIRRGEPGSDATHTEVRQFYGAIRAAKAQAQPERPRVPPAPAKPKPPANPISKAVEAVASALGIMTAHRRQVLAYEGELRRWRKKAQEVREQEANAWERLKALAVLAPIERRRRGAPGPKPPHGPSRTPSARSAPRAP